MAGGPAKSLSQKPPSSSSQKKSRWEPESNPLADQKTGTADLKNQKPYSNRKENPTPSSLPAKSPAHALPLTNQISPYAGAPFSSIPSPGPAPPPKYGFHMLDRRSIVLSDGSVRTYFALPPDYQDFPPGHRPLDHASRLSSLGPFGRGPEMGGLGFDKRLPPDGPLGRDGINGRDDALTRGRQQDYWGSLGLDGRGVGEPSLKRKYADDVEDKLQKEHGFRDDYSMQRHLLHGQKGYPGDTGTSSPYRRDRVEESRPSKVMRSGGGCDMGGKHPNVDPDELKKAFLRFSKLINESESQKKAYLEDGKEGRVPCLACGRTSKDFPDMHSLVMHTCDSDNTDSHVDHLGLHKALCVLMGWDFSKTPDNSKVYQFLSADEAEENQDDLIVWPPLVIVHNTATGKGKEGRIEGLGNKAMDNKLRDLGFASGKAKSLYSKDGHLGVTLVKFAGDSSGLQDAVQLSDFFLKQKHGREDWARVGPNEADGDSNPDLVEVDDKSGEKKRVFYGYLATALDLDKLDADTRKKATIESRKDK